MKLIRFFFFEKMRRVFQCFRRWLSAKEFEDGQCVGLAKDPLYFDEVLSVTNDHIFSIIFSTNNLLEYRSPSAGIEEEANGSSKANMLIRAYKAERRLISLVCGTGITSITNIAADLGEGRFSVATYTTTNAIMRTHSDPDSKRIFFELFDGDQVIERSNWSRKSLGADSRRLLRDKR